jgi:hypothetical protein
MSDADRSQANKLRRLQRKIDRLRSVPGADQRAEAILDRAERDPAFAEKVGRLLAKGLQLSARRADAAKTGGIAADRSMTAEARITRAHKGGLAAFYRGGNATTYGKHLVDRREKKRRRSRLNLLK